MPRGSRWDTTFDPGTFESVDNQSGGTSRCTSFAIPRGRRAPVSDSPAERSYSGFLFLEGPPSVGFSFKRSGQAGRRAISRIARGQGRLLTQPRCSSLPKYSIRPFCWTETTGALE